MNKFTVKKLIGATTVIVALVAAFFWGGNAANPPNEQYFEPMEGISVVEHDTNQIEAEKQPNQQPVTMTATESPKPSDTPKEDTKKEADKPLEVTAAASQPSQQNQPNSNADDLTCILTVRCDTLLANKDKLKSNKVALVPDDGIIFATKTVVFHEGESVFNVLQREMKQSRIHMEFNNVPVYNSAYIEGIGNLYEFDAGELSGWEYKVNGEFPGYGCSRYTVKPGDVIEWLYTCDLGRDIGADGITGNRAN